MNNSLYSPLLLIIFILFAALQQNILPPLFENFDCLPFINFHLHTKWLSLVLSTKISVRQNTFPIILWRGIK